MKRVIKFRAWNSKHEDMNNDVIFTGNLNDIFVVEPHMHYMQFTGLLDKNGVEVYEGDIFGELGGDKDKPNEYEIFGEVYFDAEFAGFCVKYPSGGWTTLGEHLLEKQNHREVIGNVYENKDLL